MKRICMLVLAAILLLSTLPTAVVAADGESFSLVPYISKLSVDNENPDYDVNLMLDGHMDTAWRSARNSTLPHTVTLDFGGRTAKVSGITMYCTNAADEGVSNIDVDYLDADGEWKPLRRSISLVPKTEAGSGMIEAVQLESRPTAALAVRIRVNEAKLKNGSFNIAEINLVGTAIAYPEGSAEKVVIEADCGDIVSLPDEIVWNTAEGAMLAPVTWKQKEVFCKDPGEITVIGEVGTAEVEAIVKVSEKTAFENIKGHWSRDFIEELQLRGIYVDEDKALQPDAAAVQKNIVSWLHKGLGISYEYLPEKVELTRKSYFNNTEMQEPSELAALGIWGDAFDENGTMTRMEAAELFRRIYEYETDSKEHEGAEVLFSDVVDVEEKETLGILANAGIISNTGGAFRREDTVTNAEILAMLQRTIEAATQTRVYPVPEDDNVQVSSDYIVKVNGQEVGTYLAHTFPGVGGMQEKTILGRPAAEVSVSYFDFFGEANVEITVNNPELGDASQVVIRPLSLGIKPTVDGNKIKFKLYKPCNISIEPWGMRHALQLFANPIDKNKPDFQAENVHYFGPGVHYIDPLELHDNDTVYIDGGAVVYAKEQQNYTDGGTYYGYKIKSIDPLIYAYRDKTGEDDKIQNITIRGRGILSGSNSLNNYQQRHQLLRVFGVKNARIDGVTLLESSAWNMFVAQCNGVYINNVKMVGYYANNDGIDFCDSKNGVVENCFANNADDSFLIKSWAEVDNVHFRNCTAWNTVSTSFGAVCELYRSITDVTYKDCTVIHSTNPRWTEICGGIIGIWDNHAASIDGMAFENIVIEDAVADKAPIKIAVYDNQAEGDAEVKNILFKDITVLDSRDDSIVLTTVFADGIHDVTFENVTINGKKVTEIDERFSVKNAKNVYFKP